MTKVTIVGAGGKMGCRLTDNLKDSNFDMTYLEVSPEGIERVKSRGVEVSQAKDVVPEADYVIFAVPDIAIKSVTSKIVPMMKPGAVGVSLDPAAPLAGHLFAREDISYFASHPSHPSVFNWEPNEKAHLDYFGGISAKQSIVCALVQGPEEVYQAAEELAKIMFAPVTVSHKITIEQMGILEPALSETFGAAVVTVLKEGVDRVVELGVPKEAAYDFFLGHINIELALLFNQLPGGQFSDAALKAINIGKGLIFRDNWKDVFESKSVKEQINAIT
ncbi:MAG: semialdehyde dehydrogenase [Flammeovirgaceae bacterium]|nr:semialdehyde dehydrogenase [Flammeovirgaceae bacterium]